eukprot:2873457-Rhodomonas_salina.1
MSDSGEPKTIAEAIRRPDGESWWKSTVEEMKAWHALKVYDIVDEFEVDGHDVEIIDGKVVYKLKLD